MKTYASIKCTDPIRAIIHEHNMMIEIASDKSYKRARDYENISTGLLEALIHLGYDVVTNTEGYIVAAEKAEEAAIA